MKDAQGSLLNTELEGLIKTFYEKIDPFLKIQFQKRGITVMQNTYIGFDTEYELKEHDSFLNRLLSAQGAVQARTIVKVPLYTVQDISYVHPLTNEISAFYVPEGDKPLDKKPSKFGWVNKEKCKKVYIKELKTLNASLKNCVEKVRSILLHRVLSINNSILESLGRLECVSYVDKRRDQVVFALPLSEIKHFIDYPEHGYSMKQLIERVNSLMNTSNSTLFDTVLQHVNITGLLNPHRLKPWYDNSRSKIRVSTRLQFDNGAKINLSLITKHYVSSHYNSADLSMLNDFELLKPMLSIINKSFVTLRKPLRLYDSQIFIRDTILLAPAGKNGLGSIGELYSLTGDYSKVDVFDVDKSKMSEFLSADKEMFEKYAVRDALIVLKHSVAMEQFNFGVKQLGIPLTLSSMGRNYVFDK